MDIRNITIGFLFIVLTSSFSAIKIHHTGSFFRFPYTVNFMALSVKNIKPKSCKLPSPFIICTPQIYKLYKPAKNFIHIISHGMDSYCPYEKSVFRCSVKYLPKNLFRRIHSPLLQISCFFREIPAIQSKPSPQKGRLFHLPGIFFPIKKPDTPGGSGIRSSAFYILFSGKITFHPCSGLPVPAWPFPAYLPLPCTVLRPDHTALKRSLRGG